MTDNNFSSFTQKVNGIDFYCELRGNGPTVVLVPSGEGDCGSYAKAADMLANEFTVFTFDMRGCSRSSRPADLGPITPEDLASDVAGLIKAQNLEPATIYGSSSGGQAVLSVGLHFPEVARNLMVHEAALINDSPLSDILLMAWKGMCDGLTQATGSKNVAAAIIWKTLAGDEQAWSALGTEYHDRINKNGELWLDLMVGNIDTKSYTAQQLQKMPPLVFSAGLLGMSWLALANLATAQRAKAEMVYLLSAHYPQVTMPEGFAEHIKTYAKKYLK
jgi:pimeloyl-ACP methyl ester carboxylesterase